MSNIYVLLDPFASPDDARAFTDTVTGWGGTLQVFLEPRLAVVDGDDSVADALRGLVGAGLSAVGVDDVSELALAADSVDVAAQIAVLASTTPFAEAAAELVRPGVGADWTGFGCVVGEEV
jgi:hypothetical protein